MAETQVKKAAPKFVLPTERRKAQNYNPRLLVLYGFPKSGKSSVVASLDNNLILDLEDGYRALEVMTLNCQNVKDLFEVKALLEQKKKETGELPYRFITIDNATRLESFAIPYANSKYRKTAMGQNWGFLKDRDGNVVIDPKTGKPKLDPTADVRLLPQGAGYLYLREALKEIIHMFQPFCETLILVCHVKDKQIKLNGAESNELVVDLAGKLGDIICGEADAVGYIYRKKNQTIISFDGGDNLIREARPLHLRGKQFVVGESDENNNLKFNMSSIFLDNDKNGTAA